MTLISMRLGTRLSSKTLSLHFCQEWVGKMALKTLVGERILNDVIRSVKTPGEWKVLVVDSLAMRVISSCCKMQDIVMEGVTIVEDLGKKRQSLPLEAIYFITPSENSCQLLLDDFKEVGKFCYKAAHIFFTEACPAALFERLASPQHALGRRIKTLKEVNVSFLPVESQVFSLDFNTSFGDIYSNSSSSATKGHAIERIAQQLATLCATLGEYPSVRYRQGSQLSTEVARATMSKLDAYKADDPSMGDSPDKQQSQLVILDRGFDPVTPLLHELTLQAMTYDLLEITNDVYKYRVQDSGEVHESLLDDNDDIWVKLRHQHIAVVLSEVNRLLKEFTEEKRMGNAAPQAKTTTKDLSMMLKRMPQYQKELNKYALHLNLADECMKEYGRAEVEKLCAVEQDLATGTDKDGEKIKDHMRSIVPVLLDSKISEHDKLRIILLHAITKQGITEENMAKLMEHAKISVSLKASITNMSNLGVPVVDDAGKRKPLPPRKERKEETYNLSRYVPYAKDIMEDIIEKKLDNKLFPYVMMREAGYDKGSGGGGAGAGRSARYWNWQKDKTQADARSGPRVIFFVIGGVTYSEMRSAYQVTQNNKQWEVLVGGTELLTPRLLLHRLKELYK